MAKILIVEDEVLIGEQLKRYLLQLGHICCGHATSYEEAVELLNTETPEVILLDIHLYGKRSGIDLAHYIKANYKIPYIYLTSHFEKSTLEEAKNTMPAGYLTKPYQLETLGTTIEICLFNHTAPLVSTQKIEIQEGKKTHLFPPDEIQFLESEHVYTCIVLSDRKMLIRKSLNEIDALLPENQFMRVHKSFIINIAHIQQIGSAHIIVNGNKIPIGRTFKKDIQSIINPVH